MYVLPKNKGKALLRYRTLNSTDVEQLEKSSKKEKEQTSNRGRLHRDRVEKESCTEGSAEGGDKKKKGVGSDSTGKTKNNQRDSNSDSYELDPEYLEKLLDEDDDIVTPTTWKIVDIFFAWVIVLLKVGIFITLICISCDQDGKGCLACSNCKNEEFEISSLPVVGSIFAKN